MSDSNRTVSIVGQRLVETVMAAVVEEFDRGDLSQDDYIAAVLRIAYESTALALGWLDISACIGGVSDEERASVYQQLHRFGQALAIEKHGVPDSDPRMEMLTKTLQPELNALRDSRTETGRKKGPLN